MRCGVQGGRGQRPITADLTGGLAEANLDMADLAATAREEHAAKAAPQEAQAEAETEGTIRALPSPPRGFTPAPPPEWDDLDVDPTDLVVIVGGAEIGPYGSSRTRFEMEVENELSAAGVLELAWTTGLIRWEDDPNRVGMTPNPATWSTKRSWLSVTTTP